ncbi:HAD family hydrolase [soil metagenome]
MSRPAIFLDRDGVIVEEVFYPHTGEREAPLSPDDVRLIPGAAAGLGRLSQAGFLLILISNQGAHAKGKVSLRTLWLVHLRFVALLAEAGVAFDDVFYSYAHPDGVVPHFSGPSLDRKPGPYNLFIAAARHDIDLARSWTIGDRESDAACGQAAGTRTIRIAPHMDMASASKADLVVAKLADAVGALLGHERGRLTQDQPC